MRSLNIQRTLAQNFSPIIMEIANIFYNFALLVQLSVKPFTSKITKPVLPVFTIFYRYKLATLHAMHPVCLEQPGHYIPFGLRK